MPFRIDPILEPIGFGFAASLGRYLEVRRRYPEAEMIMGVGNLTELTDVDSAGVNTLLVGFCQELGDPERADDGGDQLGSFVGPRARPGPPARPSCRDSAYPAQARRAASGHAPRSEGRRFGPDNLAELQRRIRDPNWRIFAEGGKIYALNNTHFLRDPDPFVLFEQMGVTDPRMRSTWATS